MGCRVRVPGEGGLKMQNCGAEQFQLADCALHCLVQGTASFLVCGKTAWQSFETVEAQSSGEECLPS